MAQALFMPSGISTTTDNIMSPSVSFDIEVVKTDYPIKHGNEADVWIGKACIGTTWKTVALKQMRVKFLNDPSLFRDFMKLLRQHVKTGQRLEHPNVASPLGLGYDKSHGSAQALVVLPFFPDGNIVDILRNRPGFTDQDKIRLAVDMLRGLEHLHSHGLPHGNLHPGKVLVDTEGTAKLADAGLDSVMCSNDEYKGIHRNCYYMPPERLIARDEMSLDPPSESADMWAMAFIVAQMWTMERPFAHLAPYKFIRMLEAGRMASVDRPTQVPVDVWAVIKDCFKLVGENRKGRPSAKQVLDGLEMLLVGRDLV